MSIVDKHLPGETQLAINKAEFYPDVWVQQLEAAIDEGLKLSHSNGVDLLKAYKILRKERDEFKEDARNRADRLDQIRRLA